MPGNCCPECFGDRGLRNDIIPTLNPEFGACSYCGAADVQLVPPSALRTYFELLANVYEPSSNGKTLAEWMKEDWALFSHPKMDIAHAKELLGDVLDNGDAVRKLLAPSPSYQSKALVQWETLRDEMMYRNRWFLDTKIDSDRLSELLPHLSVEDPPGIWYRARLQTNEDAFSLDEMGAPPSRRSSHGRANPAGIPYLYLASRPETAVAEVRPHTGEVACVAEFTVPRIRVVDLRNPRAMVSPFILSDATAIGQLRADLPLLERLGEELTRPVLPQGAAIDYIPSQYLCEFIKRERYDGVVYRSSVSDGFNLALFDPKKGVGKSTALYSIQSVTVKVAKV